MADKIKLGCKCGSTFEMDLGMWINKGGLPNADGVVYVAELRANEWLNMHRGCLVTGAPENSESPKAQSWSIS